MPRKNISFLIIALAAFMMACTFGGLLSTSTPSPAIYQPTNAATEASSQPQGGDLSTLLREGSPCEENPDLTCITLQVPLNHFDSSNNQTLDVVFGVAPATGERYGMFVQAFPGGPGGEGISSSTLSYFDHAILEHFDIVFFDQRGLGLSSPLACPKAYATDFLDFLTSSDQAGKEGLDTPAEQQDAINSARTFVESCVKEVGVDPAQLAYYGTDQVAGDLESFRQAVGDEKFWLYGVSYGTAVAQTYAAAHPEHLAGMILDGTIDLTLTGEEGALAQEKAFDKVLVAVLKACDEDAKCADALGGDALSVYDQLAESISKKPIEYDFRLTSGEVVKRTFTFNQLEFTAAYQMYSITSRMLFLRALAAAHQGDIVPMARLLYKQATVDPATFDYVGDSTFSDTMFYGVNCTDDSYFAGTPEERIAETIEAGQASNGTVPRLDGGVYTGLYCALWPSAPRDVVKQQPLTAPGVPTLVLNSTLDPATPFEQGKTVAERLADGYHIYVEGGQHSIFGYGNECPDNYVRDLLVNGKVPDQREIVCNWDPAVVADFQPLMPKDVQEFNDPLDIFWAIDAEIYYSPEYYYSYFQEQEAFACPFGGSFTFEPNDVGEAYSYENCSFTNGFSITGTGNYNYSENVITLNATVGGAKTGTLTYTHNYGNGTASLTGEYGGETIDLQR